MTKRNRIQILAMMILPLGAFVLAAPAGSPAALTFESGETQATLLELFTSEGCSSCPPADAWIGKLKTSGDLWKNFVPVVYHVDYWDRLGWRDRFAKPAFTARQQRYAAEWGSGSVYTPAFVANGREWRGWFGGGTPAAGSAKAGRLRIALADARQLSAQFTPAAPGGRALKLQVALLGSNLESKVARGENSGRNLRHEFVVLDLITANLSHTGESFAAEITLPNEQSPDKPSALAAWVTSGDAQPTLPAAGGWLKP